MYGQALGLKLLIFIIEKKLKVMGGVSSQNGEQKLKSEVGHHCMTLHDIASYLTN